MQHPNFSSFLRVLRLSLLMLQQHLFVLEHSFGREFTFINGLVM